MRLRATAAAGVVVQWLFSRPKRTETGSELNHTALAPAIHWGPDVGHMQLTPFFWSGRLGSKALAQKIRKE